MRSSAGARATALMTVGTILSRITGLARVGAIVAALGVAETKFADTYNLANTAPNIIYELVLGGILTSVFVPVFVQLLEEEGRDRAWEVASGIVNVAMVVLAAVTIVGIVCAPWLAKLYAMRLEGDQTELQREALTFLLRLFIPQIVFYGLTAITAGLLNAHKRFGAPMYTPILNNLAVIAIFIVFYRLYGTVTLETVTTSQMLMIGLGTTAGVVLMALAQLPFLRGLGKYRATLRVDHPAVRKLARLSVFVVGYVVVNQIGYFVVQILANEEQGAYTAYVTAFTFFMLPHGLFAVSVITALLPGMSAFAVREEWDAFRGRLSTGARATVFLVLPAAVGYLVLGEPIVRLLVERGVVTERSTELVAGVLRVFVVGLLPFSLFQLFLRAFYSLQDTKTPFLINCGAVALTTGLNVPLFHLYGVRGLAAGHACGYVAGAAVQGRVLARRLPQGSLFAGTARTIAAAAGMGALVWLAARGVGALVDPGTLTGNLLEVGIPVLVGVASYVVLARVFGVPELEHATRLLRGRARTPHEGGSRVDNEHVDETSYRRDERGLVVAWLVRVLVLIGLAGVVLFDAGAIAVNFFTLDGTADEVAVEVSTLASTGIEPIPNLQCNRRSRVPACAAVYTVAREHGVRVVKASYDQEGVFHIELKRTAETLIVGRIGAIEDWATAKASARAGTTN